MVEYQIESRQLPEQPTAVVRASVPMSGIADWLAQAYQEVAGYLGRSGTGMSGPPIARYTIHDDVMDLEAGFPVPRPVAGEGDVVPSVLPAGPAAVTTHHGRYEDLPAAYGAVVRWLSEHGHSVRGAHWEIYYTDPQRDPDPTHWRTDVVVPYQPS